MRLETVSIKNIQKHPGRVAFLAGGLTVMVATIVALHALSQTMYADFQRRLDEYGANMVITAKSDKLPLSYGGVALGTVEASRRTLTNEDVKKLKTIKNRENLAVISPKIVGVDRLRGRDSLIVGVNFTDELRIKKWWEIRTGRQPRAGAAELLAGAEAAGAFNLQVGDQVEINSEVFEVVGILDSVGSAEDRPLYVELKTAQRLFARPGELDIIEVAAWCYDCPIEVIVGQTSEKLPHAEAVAVIQAAKTRNRVVSQFNIFALALSGAIILLGGLTVFSSMLAAVRERRREIGLLRAIGFRGFNILEIVLFETTLIAIVSALAGYALGLGAAYVFAPTLGLETAPTFSPIVGYFAVLGTLLLTLVSSLFPAITAAKLSPNIALRDI